MLRYRLSTGLRALDHAIGKLLSLCDLYEYKPIVHRKPVQASRPRTHEGFMLQRHRRFLQISP